MNKSKYIKKTIFLILFFIIIFLFKINEKIYAKNNIGIIDIISNNSYKNLINSNTFINNFQIVEINFVNILDIIENNYKYRSII